MVKAFERGLAQPMGHVPADPALAGRPAAGERRGGREEAWRSEQWRTRRGKLFAVPGDLSLGYRLPLGSLPYVPPSDYPYIHTRDTTEPREPLPDYREQRLERVAEAAGHGTQDRVEQKIIEGAVRHRHHGGAPGPLSGGVPARQSRRWRIIWN